MKSKAALLRQPEDVLITGENQSRQDVWGCRCRRHFICFSAKLDVTNDSNCWWQQDLSGKWRL